MKKTKLFGRPIWPDLVLVAAAAWFLLIIGGEILPFAIYETPVFCNGYSWISCVAKDATPAAISKEIEGWDVFNPNPAKAECLNYQCRITGFDTSWTYEAVRLVVGSQKYSLNQLPVTVAQGQQFYFNAEGYPQYISNQIAGTYYFVPVNKILLWTGSAGSTVGTPVLGADGCSFNAAEHDRILALFNQVGGEIDKTKFYTVPVGFAYSIVDSEKRHICGYEEEECQADSDCLGHPLTWSIAGDSECSNGYLNRYGCRQYSTPVCLEWDSDNREQCLEFGDPLSRCEVVERSAVQCCPYTDSCGEGVCDPETYTCQQPPEVECTQDWECGQAQYCDRSLKQIIGKACVSNFCVSEVVQSVECCYDIDCPLDYYCSAQYACLESVQPEPECPYACCVDDSFMDKPAPPGKVCCPDHTVADNLEACETGTTPGGDPDEAKEACESREFDGIFILGYTWVEEGGFIGLFPVGKCVPVYNWPLVVLAAAVLVFLLAMTFVLRKPKKRASKKRRRRK